MREPAQGPAGSLGGRASHLGLVLSAEPNLQGLVPALPPWIQDLGAWGGGRPWASGLLGSSSPLTAGPPALWLVLWFHLFFSGMRP